MRVHLYLGLSAGLVLAVVGLTGAALVFNEQLVRWEAGDVLFAETGEGEWRPVSEWIKNAEARYPDLAPFDSIHAAGAVPLATGVPALFKHLDGGPRGEGHGLVGINPVTGEPTGFVLAEDIWAGAILLLHMELLAQENGATVVAIAGVLAFISVFTGLYLWWPKPGRWRQSVLLREGASGPARLLDLHNVPAIWLLVPLLVVLFTGLYLQKPAWIDPIARQLSVVREPQTAVAKSSPPGTCERETSLDDAITLARAQRPGLVMRQVWLPDEPLSPYYVELRDPASNPRAGGTSMWIDRNCPRVMEVLDNRTFSAAETLKAWLWPLHADLALGLAGQVLVFLSGLVLAGLLVTGLMLWWQRR